MADVVIVPERPRVPVTGGGSFPVRRIFCVGKNYADHVREMGGDPKKGAPTFFTKPADAVCLGGGIDYPLATENLHFEGELVVALQAGGEQLSSAEAASCIYGYAAGCDLTRRDLQASAKAAGNPWDTAKALDHGAMIGPIARDNAVRRTGALRLRVNGTVRQQADLSDMIWDVEQIIVSLSGYWRLMPGDLIYTGTPEGVGPLQPGDAVRVDIDGLAPLAFAISARQ